MVVRGENRKPSAAQGAGCAPRGQRREAGGRIRVSHRLDDAKKVRSLRMQALGWTCVHFRNSQEDKTGVGGNRVGWKERQKGWQGWTHVTLETFNVHIGKEPRPWTESGPHLGQVERQSPGGGIFKY